MTVYSNPRKSAVITDWPYGSMRTTAKFYTHVDPKRGERVVRITINPKTGLETAPKKLTFAKQMLIVDGDDGKTYILGLTSYGFINVTQGNMQFQEETVHADNPRYAELRAMFGG